MALFSINAILALAAGIISIVISSYTCRAVCCPCGAGTTAVQQIPIPMTDLDLTKVIYTTQTSLNNECQEEAQQSHPPAYKVVNPVGNQHEDKEYTDNSASDDKINGQYKSGMRQNAGQQPVIVVVQAPPTNKQQCDEERYQKLFPKKTIKGMSVFMVVAGILSIIIQVKRPKVS